MDANVINVTKLVGNNDNKASNSDSGEMLGRARKLEGITKNISALTDVEKKELPISEKVIIDAIERANKAVSIANRRFEYSIHEGTKEIMVKVINSETEEIIREIPPEKILDLVATLWEMVGIIVDERR